MRVLSTIKFTMLRLVRGYIVLLLLFVIPIVLLTVFSFVLGGMAQEDGTPYFNQTAQSMVLVFQLFGGATVMHYINYDLFTVNRLRMNAAPFNRTMYAFSVMMCGTIYSILLGIMLMAYSQFVLGAAWDYWGWLIYMVALMSILSSIVCVILVCCTKRYKLAERLSEVYGIGSVLLAGMLFPMPRNAVFEFLGSYGNPLSLSIRAVAARSQGNVAAAWFHANLLLAAIVFLFIVMLLVGRRRMT